MPQICPHRWRGRRRRGDSPKRRGMPTERGLGPAGAGSEQPEKRSPTQPPVGCVLVVHCVARHASCSTCRVNQGTAARSARQCRLAEFPPKWCKRSGRYAGAAGVSVQGIRLDCENVRPRVRRAVHRYSTSRSGLTASGDDTGTMVEPRASCRGGCDNGPMTKSELIQRIAQAQPELVERDVALAVNMKLEHMAACLSDGGRIEIRGFGSFSVRFRRARVGRNPRTGTAVSLPARYAPYFKPGKGLRERLNRPHESTHDAP